MSNNKFPAYLKLNQLAQAQAHLSGVIELSRFERLKEHAAIDESTFMQGNQLLLDINLGIDESGWLFIKGTVNGQLTLICQRCLEPMPAPVAFAFILAKASDVEQAKLLPPEYEPIILVEESISAVDLIEDDLLLSLPLVPAHEHREDCNIEAIAGVDFLSEDSLHTDVDSAANELSSKGEGKMDNPFSVLEQLKNKKPKDNDL